MFLLADFVEKEDVMKRFAFSLLFASLVLSGCYKEQDTAGNVLLGRGLVICAESMPLSKSDIDKGKSTWEPGDEISVIYEGKMYIYKTGQNGNQVTFISEDGIEDYDPSKRIIAYYPPIGVDEIVGVSAEQSILFKGEEQINSSKAPLVGLAEEGLSSDGALLKMSFRNICSVLELRMDAGAVSDRIKTLTVEPASETGFEGYLSFTGTVDPSTLSVSPSSTGSTIKLTLPETASLDRPLTLKIPVGRFKSPSGLKLTVEGTNGNALSRVVYSTGVESYSEAAGVISVKHLAKPLYPFVLTPPEAVDLGLSVMWASCNVGATAPEEYGNYYAWGETETKSEYSWSTYKWGSGETSLTKYNTNSSNGTVDNIVELQMEDDVAIAKLGSNWRMPTSSEYQELINNCSYSWITYNGIQGIRFSSNKAGYTDKWIFFPAAGYLGDVISTPVQVGDRGCYWTSSLRDNITRDAFILDFNSNDQVGDFISNGGVSVRLCGHTVRPVLADASSIPVASISIEPTAMLIEIGKSASVTATVRPSNATDQMITWSSSDPSIATVNQTGEVTAVKEGDVTILATCGDRSVSCHVMVKPVMPSGPVNLGLSVPWASCNLGASSPEEYGDYYAWGEIATKTDYSWLTYKFRTSGEGWSNVKFSKYNTQSSYGPVDDLTELQMSDDAAHIKLGVDWRMPTKTEFQELIDNCTNAWVSFKGKYGMAFIGKGPEFDDKWLFFPASGFINELSSFVESGASGYYWSLTLCPEQPNDAYFFSFSSSDVGLYSYSGVRCSGRNIRPVYGEIPVSYVSIDPARLPLNIGGSSTLNVKISPSNASDTSVAWSSSDPSVATVDQTGKVTAIAEGTAIITAASINNPEIKAESSIFVVNHLPSVPFVMNYNAKRYSSSTKSIPAESGASINKALTLSTAPSGFSGDHLTISNNTYSIFTYTTSTNPLQLNASNPNMTIVIKAKTTQGENIIANRSSNDDYNWMARLNGDRDWISFHTGKPNVDVGQTVNVVTKPNVFYYRISNLNVEIKSVTDNRSNTIFNAEAGKNSNSFAFFRGYTDDDIEYWYGDFYWIYISRSVLTDEQIQQVIDYNETR